MKQRFYSQYGGQLSYTDYGDKNGYPILVQHGLIASIDDYDLFGRLTQANARLICVARPGYGDSSPCILESFAVWADYISPLVRELGLARFDVLAHVLRRTIQLFDRPWASRPGSKPVYL